MQDGSSPDKVMLSPVELLELKNIQLQKKICNMEMDKVMIQERVFTAKVNERAQIDLKMYAIDIETGECVLRKAD